MNEYSFLLDCSPKAFIILDIQTKSVTFHNKLASELYGNSENVNDLEEIFRLIPNFFDDNFQAYKKEFELQDTVKICKNIYTMRQDGERELVDVIMSFIDPQQTSLILELVPKEDNNIDIMIDMLDQSKSAMFYSNFDTELSLLHGNKAFFDIFGGDKNHFQEIFRNSFASTLVEVDKNEFVREVVTIMRDNSSPYNKNIQIETKNKENSWFHLNLEHQLVSEGRKAYRGMLLPIQAPIIKNKAQENYAQYFEAIQELSGGTMFFVDTKSMTSTHHSDFLTKCGFPDKINNFPYCAADLFHPDDQANFKIHVENMLKGTEEPFEFRYITENDTYKWAKLTHVSIYDKEGAITEIVARVSNKFDENMLSIFDPVTYALNPAALRDQIEAVLEDSQGDTEPSHAVLFMDLDNFKVISDQFGNETSDKVLSELGSRLKTQIRGDDIFGRIGEDRFILFLKNVSKFEILLRKANGLRDTIKMPFNDGEREHTVHGSIGISVFPLHGTTYNELQANAEIALIRSKSRGKNMATIFKPQKEVSTAN